MTSSGTDPRASRQHPRAEGDADLGKLLANPPSASMGMGSLILDEIGGPSAGAAVMIAFVIFLVYWILSGRAASRCSGGSSRSGTPGWSSSASGWSSR